ncbi:lambda-crystallin homolog [Olea europaea subsp. europaea]|uniref:Lambda-crystallin homolog n=1 Tax=Olea europaea subsp. europaea TaxID=158383 RepID=A0A8S0TRB9_OLEEU|nr:lambda-crystallin homolog [Olea europaea subsp. europaea]
MTSAVLGSICDLERGRPCCQHTTTSHWRNTLGRALPPEPGTTAGEASPELGNFFRHPFGLESLSARLTKMITRRHRRRRRRNGTRAIALRRSLACSGANLACQTNEWNCNENAEQNRRARAPRDRRFLAPWKVKKRSSTKTTTTTNSRRTSIRIDETQDLVQKTPAGCRPALRARRRLSSDRLQSSAGEYPHDVICGFLHARLESSETRDEFSEWPARPLDSIETIELQLRARARESESRCNGRAGSCQVVEGPPYGARARLFSSSPASDRSQSRRSFGLIGRAWAVLFASHGYRVKLYDTNEESTRAAPELIRQELVRLFENDQARGTLSLEERMALVGTFESLGEALERVVHVQECVYDELSLKQEVFEQIDEWLGDQPMTSICSSTSIHLPSLVFSRVKTHRDQCLVAHPINPLNLIRLVELVPCKETRLEILLRTRITMDEIGQKPVVLRKEVSGFAINRLKYALFQEAFRLVHDGVMTPDDVDTVVSDGLGPRYAFMGPWMTAHLNATGMGEYLMRYSEGIYNVSKDCQPLLRIQGEAAQQIVDSMAHVVPLDKLDTKRAWRDKCLGELAKSKEKLGTGM